jgi:hypothetical protein
MYYMKFVRNRTSLQASPLIREHARIPLTRELLEDEMSEPLIARLAVVPRMPEDINDNVRNLYGACNCFKAERRKRSHCIGFRHNSNQIGGL